MADEGKLCVCPQCGKKYKLKEGFEAKSFSCKACGATVWVAGKPPAPAPTASKAGAAPAVAKKGGRGGRTATAGSRGGGRRSHGREAREEAAEGGRHGRGREKPKSNTNILIAIGAVAVIGIVVVVAVMSGSKDKGKTQPVAEQPVGAGPGTGAAGTPSEATAPNVPAATAQGTPPGTGQPKPPAGVEPTEKAGEGDEEPGPSPEGGETTKPKLGGDKKTGSELGKNDPPATLGHLETTPPETRKQIDDLIAVMFDTMAGRDSHDAKAKLAAIGKPAFLPILGKMAAVRDTITDNDSQEERLIESSLMLADQCLREMDGYLDAKDKAIIRPGTDKKYLKYILVLHYRRWNEGMGSTPLKDMDTMPGAFDPTTMQKDPGEEDEEEGK
jgi:hypothetical protein